MVGCWKVGCFLKLLLRTHTGFNSEFTKKIVLYNYERFETRSHFVSRLSMIILVNVVLNRTVFVESD